MCLRRDPFVENNFPTWVRNLRWWCRHVPRSDPFWDQKITCQNSKTSTPYCCKGNAIPLHCWTLRLHCRYPRFWMVLQPIYLHRVVLESSGPTTAHISTLCGSFCKLSAQGIGIYIYTVWQRWFLNSMLSGHLAYARSARRYLDSMKMLPDSARKVISLSDALTIFGVETSLIKPSSSCWWSNSKLQVALHMAVVSLRAHKPSLYTSFLSVHLSVTRWRTFVVFNLVHLSSTMTCGLLHQQGIPITSQLCTIGLISTPHSAMRLLMA